MIKSDREFIRQQRRERNARGRFVPVGKVHSHEWRIKITPPMHEAFRALSEELGMSQAQHLRRIVRAYLAQNLIGYED